MIKATTGSRVALRLPQKEDGANRDDFGATAEVVDQDQGGNTEQAKQSPGIGQDKIHGDSSSKPDRTASSWRAVKRSGRAAIREKPSW